MFKNHTSSKNTHLTANNERIRRVATGCKLDDIVAARHLRKRVRGGKLPNARRARGTAVRAEVDAADETKHRAGRLGRTRPRAHLFVKFMQPRKKFVDLAEWIDVHASPRLG